jgi:hypothetical protein
MTSTAKHGIELLYDPSLNRSTGFTEAEKQALSLVGLVPDGLQQDFEATLGDSGGVSICYLFTVFRNSKMPQFDIHIFSWKRCTLSLGPSIAQASGS